MTESNVLSPARLTGRHVLAILVAFFGVVFAVNGVFLTLALSTHTGLVANEPYVKGLHYNDRIAAEVAQEQLGWIVDVGQLSSEGRISVSVTSAAGPVRGLKAVAALGRPSTANDDRKLVLGEGAPGTYGATTAKLAAGAWLLDVELRRDPGSDVYRLRRRLWLKP